MVVLVEISRKAYLASIVPVVVNAILSEHQIMADIVAFVNKGDFPRSRLGEKQRGKILAGWVTRKMNTLAQFAIRDIDPEAMGGDEAGGGFNRASMGSFRSAGAAAPGASSLRRMENAPQILEQEEFDQQMDHIADITKTPTSMGMADDLATPTGFPPGLQHGNNQNYHTTEHRGSGSHPPHDNHGYEPAEIERFNTPDHLPPSVGPKPGFGQHQTTASAGSAQGQVPFAIRLPGVDGRESLDLWNNGKDDEDEEDWTANAIMHMNLAGDMNRDMHR